MNEIINNISKVEISNLWKKYDIEWELNPDVNILAGINGSGKSTILDLICVPLTVGQLTKEHDRDVNEIIITLNNGKRITFNKIVIDDTIKNIEKRAKFDEKYKIVFSELKEQEGDNLKKIKGVHFEMNMTSLSDLKMNLQELGKLLNINVISTFDNPLKTSEDVRKLSDDKVKTELDWEIYKLQKEYLDYQLNISKRKDFILENEENPKEEIIRLRHPQNIFLNVIDKLFKETKKGLNKDKNEICFITDDGIEITPYQLSSGEKQLLLILLTVLVQDNKHSILFMDEPEISLHIDWQKKLIQYIRELNPNVQLIIATHSPAVIMEGWLDKVTEITDIIVKEKTVKHKK